jgi:predicted N-acetyltransferase YhbS
MITVRYARLSDAAGISRVHRSHVKSWTRKLGDIERPVNYRSLSIDERWGFGGPWMSDESCAIRLNEMILRGLKPYVAVKRGVIVGHMELFLGREGETYGKNAHIAVLYVHDKHKGKGIGSALMDKALDIAQDERCDTLTAASAPDNVDFYVKHGLDRRNQYVEACLPVTTEQSSCDNNDINPANYAYGKNMPIGRYQSSACHIFEASVRYAINGHTGNERKFCLLSIKGSPSLFLLECGEQDTVYCWTKNASTADLVGAGLSLLSKKGAKTANMLLSLEDYGMIRKKYYASIKSMRTMLVQDLKVDKR